MAAARPISEAAFAEAMAAFAPFEPAPLLALAVSGGPDSMALAGLAARWARAVGGAVHGILIDHGLRADSAAEAAASREALAAAAVAATVIRLAGPAPATGKPAWARQERYAALKAHAAEIGALHLLTAHHRDDQAETLILNLERGSGLKGLAGMPPARGLGPVRLLRPLLGFSKADLAATAAAFGLPTVEDPTNADQAYARARVRRRLAAASPGRLAETAARLARDDAAVEGVVTALATSALSLSPLGWAAMDAGWLAAAPEAAALRLFARTAHAIGGRQAPPRQERAAAAMARLLADRAGRLTLGRARILRQDDRIVFLRETGAAEAAPIAAAGQWDGRFDIDVSPAWPGGAVCRALGYGGLRTLERAERPPEWIAAAPRAALASLPALWREETLIAAPAIRPLPPSPDMVRLTARFRPWRPLAPC